MKAEDAELARPKIVIKQKSRLRRFLDALTPKVLELLCIFLGAILLHIIDIIVITIVLVPLTMRPIDSLLLSKGRLISRPGEKGHSGPGYVPAPLMEGEEGGLEAGPAPSQAKPKDSSKSCKSYSCVAQRNRIR